MNVNFQRNIIKIQYTNYTNDSSLIKSILNNKPNFFFNQVNYTYFILDIIALIGELILDILCFPSSI